MDDSPVFQKGYPVHEGHEQYMKRKMKEEEKKNMKSKDFIWVTLQKEGIHKYPAAKDIPGVEFLASPHRHIFHFRVELEVMHDDRDVEFILFKRELESLYDKGIMQLDYKSCEMMARELSIIDILLIYILLYIRKGQTTTIFSIFRHFNCNITIRIILTNVSS